jgi:hypothetical protein
MVKSEAQLIRELGDRLSKINPVEETQTDNSPARPFYVKVETPKEK